MPKKIQKTAPKQSPYQIVNQWLFDGDYMSEIPEEWALKAINPCMFLQSFSNLGEVTIFLNDIFNNFSIYQIERIEFFSYLKDLVIRKKIRREKMSFFKHHKEDKDVTLIHSKFPELKRIEVAQFLKEMEKDADYYESFLIFLGLKEEKKTKLTVAEKKEVKERIKALKEKEAKNKLTLSDWENSFS